MKQEFCKLKLHGEKLLTEKIDIIISSPLKRAKKTAEIIASGRDIPIIIDSDIQERCFGNFEGKTPEEFDFDGIWNYKLNQKYEDAENIEDLFDRIQKFLDKIQKNYPNKTVLLVTHGGVAVPIRAILEGIPDGMEVLRNLGIDNCEVKEYEL